MRSCFYFLLALFICTSCSLPTYVFENNTSNLGLNLKEGKWLLGEIDTSFDLKKPIKEKIFQELGPKLNERLSNATEVKGIILPKKVALQPDQRAIEDLKIGTNYDYYLNVKTELAKNSLQDLDITNHKLNRNEGKTVFLFFEVYDLNLGTIIYSKKVVGSIRIDDTNNSDVNLSVSTSRLTMGCLKKVLKDIKKKSN